MDTSKKIIVTKMCRTCLSNEENLQLQPLSSKISDVTLYDILTYITDKSVVYSNEYPQQICSSCVEILENIDNFKRRCLENEKALSDMINASETKVYGPTIKEEVFIEYNKEVKPKTLQFQVQCTLCYTGFDNPSQLFDHCSKTHNIECNSYGLDSSMPIDGVKSVKDELLEVVSGDTNLDDNITDDMYTDITLSPIPIEIIEKDNTYCKECNRDFPNKNSYIKHKNLAHKGKRPSRKKNTINFECDICKTSLKSIRALNVHLKKNHPEDIKEEYCKEDSYDTSKPSSPAMTHQCSMCMRTFFKEEALVVHLKRHKEKANDKYVCSICKREFIHRAHLINHIQSRHTKQTKLPEEMIVEVTIKSEAKRHTCHLCHKSFHMLSTLKDHIRTHTGEKPFLCSICGRGFSQTTNLKEHLRRHEGLKPFKCEFCDRTFVSKGELSAHVRKHTGAHPFVCDTCGAGFTTSSSLVKHRRIHTGEKPFACDLCPMRFTASGTLKNHRRTHTGEKPYHCAQCDKAFVQRNDLVAHTRCHTGERPYVCSICGQAFRQSSALKTHLKMHSIKQTSSQLHVYAMK